MGNLAAKFFSPGVLIMAFVTSASTFATGIPVFDASNLSQNLVSAMEAVAQTLTQMDQYTTQINQYDTQLSQYDNMIKNTAAPTTYIWDKANSIITKVIDAQDMSDYYSNQAHDLDSYLNQFKSASFYRGSPCYGPTGCNDSDREAVWGAQLQAQDAEKKSTDALFKSVDQQQTNLRADAAQLERLQEAATTADGQMKAIQYANQLASNQSTQLLQIRALMAAQQSALANQMAARNDEKARNSAMQQNMTSGSYSMDTPKTW